MNNKLDKLFYKCNLIGVEVNIYDVIYNEPEQIQDAIYNYIADRMGLSNKTQLTNKQAELLREYKYI